MPSPARRSLLVVIAVLALVVGLVACQPPQGLVVTPVATDLDHPWDLAFTPDGTLLYTERMGRIGAVIDGQARAFGVPEDVFVTDEAGMMGLAVGPQFATTRRIYTCFASTAGGTGDVRVVRWVVSPDYRVLTDRTDILTGMPLTTGRHAGCRIRVGPDGLLWVTTGDAAVNRVAQDLGSLGGKVLRIDGDGVGAADNPGNQGAPARPEIYTYGHRNPQGLSFRPSDGQAFLIDHGTACDDEINKLVPGGNYGWDPVPPDDGSLYDETRPMTDLEKHPDAIPPVWTSGCPTIAPSGGTFLSGGPWQAWHEALAVAVLKDRELRVFSFSPPNEWQTIQWTAITDQGRLRVAVQGPDGALYLATDANPGSILRVTPA